jgi:hypothetical protein
MFKKIPNSFLDVTTNWDLYKTDIKSSSYYSETRGGGSAFWELKNKDILMSKLNKNIFGIPPTMIQYCEFTGGGLVTPHIDRDTTVALNLYLETADCRTIFYKVKETSGANPELHSNKSQLATVSNLNNLEEIGSFIAKNNETYLLNTDMLHGIEKPDTRPRTMITFRWMRYSYDEILESLDL